MVIFLLITLLALLTISCIYHHLVMCAHLFLGHCCGPTQSLHASRNIHMGPFSYIVFEWAHTDFWIVALGTDVIAGGLWTRCQ
jgi:hypothetical protein